MKIEELPKDALVLILDADSISYSLTHQLKSYVGEMGIVEIAKDMIDDYILQLYEQVGASHVVGLLGGEGNFRYQVAKTKPYKGNRKELADDEKKWKQFFTETLVQDHSFQRVDGIEADDAVSIAAIQLREAGINHIICSNDKDVDTIWGNHYSMNKRQFYHVTEDEASLKFWTQMITGDTIDNIPGLPRKGIAYAKRLLGDKTPDKYQESVLFAYRTYLNTDTPLEWVDYFEEQKTLLSMLTSHPSFIPEFISIDKEKLTNLDLSGL